MGATNRDAPVRLLHGATVHFNKREEQCLVRVEERETQQTQTGEREGGEGEETERNAGEWVRWGMGERGPMVLPYGKSPPAMVNARVIGGRYAGLLWEAKSNDELF